jgi:glycosyltransferase involved in cell wall biosynthesis
MARLLLDLTPLPSSKAGVGRYAFGLLEGLASIRKNDAFVHSLELVCLVKPADTAALQPYVEPFGGLLQIVEASWAQRLGRAGRLVAEQTLIPGILRKFKADAYHGIHYTVPLRWHGPSTTVFHDPTFWTHPRLHLASKVAYFRGMAALAVKKAAKLITVSEWSKRSLCSILGIDAASLIVCPHGVEASRLGAAKPEELDAFKDMLGFKGCRIVGFVGTLEPRKNLARLVAAVALLRRLSPEPVALVVAGQIGWKASALLRAIQQAQDQGWCRYLGYIDEETKRLLFEAADVIAYPSIAEGFGFPVLEAMASGTPVVTSDRTATAEIAGEAGFLADPYDVSSISKALARALFDQNARELKRQAGLRRVSAYTWEKAASCTAKVWKEVLRSA